MRVDRLEDVLREARELGVELELESRGLEGEAFQQPLDVRVGRPFLGVLGEGEPARDLRELMRELGPGLTQVVKFAFVESQQPLVHRAYPSPAWSVTLKAPVSRSTSVLR